jgi:MoCo/4Fe-4S cofactor protein with predicted Tat translocation signal
MSAPSSPHDQCPTSKKEGLPGRVELAASPRALVGAVGGPGGQKYWRSLEDAADSGEFRDWLEREFPAGASELNEPTTRRTFLQLMGASIALAGAATIPGCRRPDHAIMPYARQMPEKVVPGKPLYYATSMPLPGGGAEGLIVETHEGRPTKVEGNPLHPINRGKSSIWAQASVLGLYDPDRLKYVIYRPQPTDARVGTWDDFKSWAQEHFGQFDRTRGRGLAVIVDRKTSPSREAMRQRFMRRFPQARWVSWDAAASDGPAQGAQIAFGHPMREVFTFASGGEVRAKVIVSLDRDFLDQSEPGSLVWNREFASTRRTMTTRDQMSRLYVIEPSYTTTGACADHRLRLAPSRIAAFTVLLAQEVLQLLGPGQGTELARALAGVEVPQGADIPKLEKSELTWVQGLARDLVMEEDGRGGERRRQGETLLMGGASQPAAVLALVHALNQVLGNIGQTVRYLSVPREQAEPAMQGMVELAAAIDRGEVSTIVCVETNPVYDAPADLDFAARYERVRRMARGATVCLSVQASETAAASTWSLNGAHFLESWGDTEAWDGTIAPIQPMIAPLYGPALSEIEFLAMLADPNAGIVPRAAAPAGEEAGASPELPRVDDGHQIVRSVWRQRLGLGEQEFEQSWRRALHDGLLHGVGDEAQAASVDMGSVAREVSRLQLSAPPTASAMDVLFVPGMTYDGRYANHGWLQELPQAGTRVVWDNPALVSPATAAVLGLPPVGYSQRDPNMMYTPRWPSGRMARITVNGRAMEIAVWIMPGLAENTIVLPLGYGRTVSGRVGDGVGFNTYAVKDSSVQRRARGTIEQGTGTYHIASTQNHWSMEGRTSIVRQVDLAAWQAHGDDPPVPHRDDRFYGTETAALNFGERVGHSELGHSPPLLNIYPHPYKNGRGLTPAPGSEFSKRAQWGMSIDLSTCTGCGACTIACQAENNIPIVGKHEVAKGREMHWIRVDRYFVSEVKKGSLANIEEPEQMLHQPVACVHCDNAPCESVCPVNATVQGPEGHNYQVYNRCIGTRYCQNNCPWKVRRFNFFDYGVAKFNGNYLGQEMVEAVTPRVGGVTGSGAHNKVNPNWIPPRLRQRLDEIERMQKNPNVTVRSRGVMEKCTYCIQRTNRARVEVKLHDLQHIPDGFVQTACQQACPSDAIVFGDIEDRESNEGRGSRMRQMREHQRSYWLLGYLNTRPRTTYMVRVANPNPRFRKVVTDPFHYGDGHAQQDSGEPPARAEQVGGEGAMTRASFLRDGARAVVDRGYAVSLKVLGV